MCNVRYHQKVGAGMLQHHQDGSAMYTISAQGPRVPVPGAVIRY